MDKAPQHRIPGHAVFRLTYMGSVSEVRLRCRCEPLTDVDKARGCSLAIRQDMKAHRGHNHRAKKYAAEFIGYEPDRVYRTPTQGPHEFKASVLQDKPLICVQVKPFMAETAEEAWAEAVRRVKAAYRPEDVHEGMLYGGVVATDNPDDTFNVERPTESV